MGYLHGIITTKDPYSDSGVILPNFPLCIVLETAVYRLLQLNIAPFRFVSVKSAPAKLASWRSV